MRALEEALLQHGEDRTTTTRQAVGQLYLPLAKLLQPACMHMSLSVHSSGCWTIQGKSALRMWRWPYRFEKCRNAVILVLTRKVKSWQSPEVRGQVCHRGRVKLALSQAGLEHYEVLQVAAVEEALATLMRRCAALPEKAPPGDVADGAKSGAPRQPSEPIIPKDMKLPRFARKASTVCHISMESLVLCFVTTGRECEHTQPWNLAQAGKVALGYSHRPLPRGTTVIRCCMLWPLHQSCSLQCEDQVRSCDSFLRRCIPVKAR